MSEPEPMTYESACGRIEAIVARLDSGEAGLRETLELCQEGRRLVEFCAAELDGGGPRARRAAAGRAGRAARVRPRRGLAALLRCRAASRPKWRSRRCARRLALRRAGQLRREAFPRGSRGPAPPPRPRGRCADRLHQRLIRSSGSGKTIVEPCSAPISRASAGSAAASPPAPG